MKAINKEEYINRKNKLKQKSINYFNSKKYKKHREKHLNNIIKRAIRYITFRINHVNSFTEPREFDFNFDMFTLRTYEYVPAEFMPVYHAISEAFDYLDIAMRLDCGDACSWIHVAVSLKKEEN